MKFRTAELLKKIKKNRDNHREEFLRALAGYKEHAVEMLNVFIEEIKEGQRVRVYLDLPIPQDHTGSYEVVIEMLAQTTQEEIELSQQQFGAYVLDRWEWIPEFKRTASNYTNVKNVGGSDL